MGERSIEAMVRRNKKRSIAVTKSRRMQRIKAIEYKGGKCERCGYNKCISAFEFHHIDGQDKDFTLGSGNTRGWDIVRKELDKCIMLCANCHREEHSIPSYTAISKDK